jgi:hypothetical protein
LLGVRYIHTDARAAVERQEIRFTVLNFGYRVAGTSPDKGRAASWRW